MDDWLLCVPGVVVGVLVGSFFLVEVFFFSFDAPVIGAGEGVGVVVVSVVVGDGDAAFLLGRLGG